MTMIIYNSEFLLESAHKAIAFIQNSSPRYEVSVKVRSLKYAFAS